MILQISNYKNYKYWNWNGFKIAWNVINEGKSTPILFIHGFGASSDHWRNNIYFFVNKGYSVFIMDLLGFGKSDQPGINEIYHLNNGLWCDQVTDFISEIIRPINEEKIIIIGNSLGGLTALTCAVAIPEEISGIIASPLPDPLIIKNDNKKHISDINKFKISLIKFFIYLIPIKLILFFINRFGIIDYCLSSAYFKQTNVDKELLDIVKKPAMRKTAARSLRAMCFGMVVRSDKLKSSFLLDQLCSIKKVPFLLIWGEKDNFIPLFFGKRIAKFYTWVKLKVIANSGHCVHDEDHIKFNKICYEWIRNLKNF